MIRYILIGFLFLSCNNAQRNKSKVVKTIDIAIPKDTIIMYDIEGVSIEGTEAEIKYINGKIDNSLIKLYSGTGQVILTYSFEQDRIKVSETHYRYKTELENIKSNDDMKLDKEVSYYIDYNGNLVGEKMQDRIDVFQEFRKIVPFELK